MIYAFLLEETPPEHCLTEVLPLLPFILLEDETVALLPIQFACLQFCELWIRYFNIHNITIFKFINGEGSLHKISRKIIRNLNALGKLPLCSVKNFQYLEPMLQ